MAMLVAGLYGMFPDCQCGSTGTEELLWGMLFMALDARRADQASSRIRKISDRADVVRIDRRSNVSAEGWPGLRGDVMIREEVELVGGFPGSASRINRFRRARLTVSERWLIVNDGRVDGFAIALEGIDSLSVVPGSARSRYAIQLRYRDGNEFRTFYIKFAEPVWPFRAGDDALRVATAFVELGIDAWPIDPTSNHKRLAMSVEEMRVAALETMVWSGDVTGPIGGWLGQNRAVCQAWLTTTSFIWRKEDGPGVNRISLSDLTSAATGTWLENGPSPVVLLTVHDEFGDRHELPFVFDASRLIEENRRECAAMLGGLRMRDIPVASQHPPLQPWHGIGALLAAADASGEPSRDTPTRRQAPVSPKEFEAHCLIEIARLNRDILGHHGGSSEIGLEPVQNLSHASAAVELDRRFDSGAISESDMLDQRRRFNALIEARGKLAAIAEQRAQGTRPAAILMHQRDAVMSSLNDVIMPEQPAPMRIERVQPRMHLRLLPNPST